MCTSIMVGKNATEQQLILIARNEDFPTNNKNKYLTFRKYPEYYNENNDNPVVTGETWTLGNGLKVQVPHKMFSYSAMPDASGYEEASYSIRNGFYYEERGINKCNVAISATNSMNANDRAIATDPLVPIGIAEAIIPTLILPQAETALDAVTLLGGYVEKYGASECNGILMADPNESWYFEIGSGHHWIAIKVPEDSYIVVANSMCVHSINLDDSNNVKHSKALFEFVSSHKLLEAEELHRHNFNFAKAFGQLCDPDNIDKDSRNIGNPYDVDRIWLAQHILTPSKKQEIRKLQYPLFLKPDKKVAIYDIMKVLRATYKGTELQDIATRPIGVVRTAESHIITLDPKMPDELKGLIWQAIGTPLGAPYMPLYSVMKDIPSGYFMGNDQYSPLSAYWAFRGLYALGDFNNNEYISIIKQLWNKYEEQFINEQKYLNTVLIDMYNADPDTAIDFARKYSTGIAYQLVDIANRERNNLITKITESQKDN